MPQFNTNKLHVCPGYFLIVYETENFAHHAIETRKATYNGEPSKFVRNRIREAIARDDLLAAILTADYWANKFKCKVWAIRPNIPFLILDKRDRYWNVLIGGKIGWIIIRPWLEIKEIG
jgi:hypothetical protein